MIFIIVFTFLVSLINSNCCKNVQGLTQCCDGNHAYACNDGVITWEMDCTLSESLCVVGTCQHSFNRGCCKNVDFDFGKCCEYNASSMEYYLRSCRYKYPDNSKELEICPEFYDCGQLNWSMSSECKFARPQKCCEGLGHKGETSECCDENEKVFCSDGFEGFAEECSFPTTCQTVSPKEADCKVDEVSCCEGINSGACCAGQNKVICSAGKVVTTFQCDYEMACKEIIPEESSYDLDAICQNKKESSCCGVISHSSGESVKTCCSTSGQLVKCGSEYAESFEFCEKNSVCKQIDMYNSECKEPPCCENLDSGECCNGNTLNQCQNQKSIINVTCDSGNGFTCSETSTTTAQCQFVEYNNAFSFSISFIPVFLTVFVLF